MLTTEEIKISKKSGTINGSINSINGSITLKGAIHSLR